MPWTHLDVVGLLERALSSLHLKGAMNAVSPGAVTTADCSRALGSTLERPTVLSGPRVALRAVLGDLRDLLLRSHRVPPTVAEQTGNHFVYTEIEGALCASLSAPAPA